MRLAPFRGAQVLLSGCTGFVGKVALQELMRRKEELGVDTVYIFIRPKKNKTAEQRFFEDVVPSQCFSLLPEDWPEAVKVISGELSRADCDLNRNDLKLLTGRITHIIHCAASVEFDLPLAEAAAANITSCLNMLELARRCVKLKQLVNVSTAYVTPFRRGAGPITEVLAPLPRAAADIYRAILDGTADEKQYLAETGHPNTYTFTKCVAEHLATERKGDIPLVIVRPSIISASYRHPFPGWLDSAAAFAGFVALIGTGHLKVIVADPSARLDIVPCDVVCSRVIDCCFAAEPLPSGSIRYAVAGLRHNNRVDTSCRLIGDYFKNHQIDRAPGVTYIGAPDKRLMVEDLRHHRVPTSLARTWFRATGNKKMVKQTLKLSDKLAQLNNAFPYFTHYTFDFRASMPLDDEQFEREQYVKTVCRGVYRHLLKRDETEMSLAGRKHKDASTDLQWMMQQPDGNWAIRGFALTVRKALRHCTTSVTFDRPSFEAAVKAVPPGALMVVIPTHRSYMDFLLASYLFFSRPDLGIKIPHIAAAEEFSRIPLLGELFKKTQAFYLKRGVGKADVELTKHVHKLVKDRETLQFFIEGARSRSREFLAPRHGLLRCLQGTNETFALLPIAITYDRVPEEESLLSELRGDPKAPMQLRALAAWTAKMIRGDVQLGRIHIRCGSPVIMRPSTDVRDASRQVMGQLQAHTATTTYHLRTFLRHQPMAGVDVDFLRRSIELRGGIVLDSPLGGEETIDATSEQCLRYNWMHVFYADARALWPDHPAVLHHTDKHGYMPPVYEPSEKELNDSRLKALLRALFEPVGRDYLTVAERLGPTEFEPRHASARTLLYEAPDAHLPYLQAAFADLLHRGVLQMNGKNYAWGPNAEEIQTYKEACTWPENRVSLPKYRQAV